MDSLVTWELIDNTMGLMIYIVEDESGIRLKWCDKNISPNTLFQYVNSREEGIELALNLYQHKVGR